MNSYGMIFLNILLKLHIFQSIKCFNVEYFITQSNLKWLISMLQNNKNKIIFTHHNLQKAKILPLKFF